MSIADSAQTREEIARLTEDEVHALTKEAFFWGMHPSAVYEIRYVFTQLKGGRNYVGDGRMHWDRRPRSAADKSVTTPNATTLYGFGFFDLRREPVVVALPAVSDRYFSVQACDQYPRWFMSVGNQFTGRAAQQFLIVGPDFNGPYPRGFAAVQMYPSPSNCVLLAGRFALKSNEPDEFAAVNRLMDQTTIAPLSVWETNGRRPVRAEDQPVIEPGYAMIPRMADLVEIASTLTGVDLLQLVSLVLNDPTMTLRKDSAKEIATLQRIVRLGLAPGVAFDPAWLSEAQKEIVDAAFVEAKHESVRHFEASRFDKNGWSMSIGLIEDINDYVSQGYYGLTAIGAPIPARSHSAAFGFVDTDGHPFTGGSRYTLTFDLNDLPPVTEFWELPVYDEGGYFVDNEIDRYSINSYMLERGDLHVADGKLVIYIRHEKPTDPNQLRNWLPAPEGSFRFAFRYYGPMSGLLDGSYDMPGVVRTPSHSGRQTA
jgi:hypothetical protein